MKSYLQSQGSHCIVAEIAGPEVSGRETSKTIAGFILTERGGEFAHIITLDVLESYRRQTIGSLLLQAAEQEAASQGATACILKPQQPTKPRLPCGESMAIVSLEPLKITTAAARTLLKCKSDSSGNPK